MANVIIYSTPTCVYCKKAKEFLTQHNVPYVEKDVYMDAAAREEMIHKTGQLAVPVIDIDGKIMVGYDRGQIASILGIGFVRPLAHPYDHMAQKLSRSKIELFLECPRCFWLDVTGAAKRPPGFPYTINSAIDWLLKHEFDEHRAKGTKHPVMETYQINALPYKHADLDKWRHNFTGVQYEHAPSNLLITGAVDDVWVTPEGELVVVDYKSTGAREHKIYDSYERQMEVYQWLLRQNGFKVSPTGYFLFARANKDGGFGMGKAALSFDLFIEPAEGDDGWVETVLEQIRALLDGGKMPDAADECTYCAYVVKVGTAS